MQPQILCVVVPSYKVACARLRDPALGERPVIVVDRFERGHAVDCDARAVSLGARVGMTLVQASAAAREAAIAVDDPVANRTRWDAFLDALDAISPLVEDAGEGVAFLEMRGIAGSAERWLAAVHETLCETALRARTALATNRFVARAAALKKDGTIVAAGGERAFVARLPLGLLDVDADTDRRLRLLGLKTLGDLAALPHGPFVRRFGPQAERWHACACGVDRTQLVPRPRRIRIERSLYGEGTAEREDQVLFALRTIVNQVADDLAYIGKRCRSVRLALECEDASVHEIAIVLAQPTAAATTIFDVARARLEGVTLPAPVVGLRLGTDGLEEGGTEIALFAGTDPDPETIAILLARLDAALGGEGMPQVARRARIVPHHRLEARATYDAYEANARRTLLPHANAPTPSPEGTFVYRVHVPRAIAVRLRAGVPVAITDGGRTYDVLDAGGPWRTNESWWARPIERDEYDVLLATGSLIRIACEAGEWTIRGAYD